MMNNLTESGVFPNRTKGLFSWLGMSVTILLLLIPLGSLALAEPVTTENISKKIVEARTTADHKAIAAFYRAQAEEADARVKMHEKMKQSYRLADKDAYRARWHRSYCNNLINSSRTEKENYEALAEEHEEAAE